VPVKRQSTRDYIKEVLLERILDGTYQPGERLVELQIARELETSQGPVREALRDLEALRLVESANYKGTHVREFSDREIDDAYQLRSVLEQLAAELAAPNLKGNTLDLEKEAAAFSKAAKSRDLKSYSSHDMEFHRRIISAAGNQLLEEMWDKVVLESRFRFTLIHRIGEHELENLAKAHLPIIGALNEGNATKAGELARNLIISFHSRKAQPQ
jgi:DNA-binding GntR family transcriptional regulator